MDFSFTPEQEAFRGEVCSFLRQELSAERLRANYDPAEFTGLTPDFARRVRRRLGERGFIGQGLPREYGGGGRDIVYDAIFAEELEYHRFLVVEGTITYLPYALLAFGTEEQKRAFLPRMCQGEVRFFLGYSEPEAGSDLANLSARAIPKGDHFLLTGRKVYASEAHLADYGWVAARTDPAAPKHRGISLFIVDMKSPGITITKHRTLVGWLHPEVTFDQVPVPAQNLVGEANRGWDYTMTAIDYERLFLASPGQLFRSFQGLLSYCLDTVRDGRPGLQDPVVAHRMADLAVEVSGSRLLYYWAASQAAHGRHPLPEASLALLVKRETARRLDGAALEVMGPDLQLKAGSPGAPLGGRAEREYLEDLYFHFAAGGFDITRNVIAARGLDLPH